MCIVLISQVGCELAEGTSTTQIPNGDNLLTVNVARAKFVEDVMETSTAFGTIKPRRSSSLGFARAGRVTKVYFDVGDFVAEGQKIAELDQGELVNQQQDLDSLVKKLNEDLDLLRSQPVDQRFRQKEQELAELTSQQQRLTREFEKGFIVAPYRGVIAERNAEVGDAVPAGRPYFRILEADQPMIALNVPLQIANRIEVGTEVEVLREGKKIFTKVATKSPELDSSSRTLALTLNITDNQEARSWNYGEVVEVQFFLATNRDGFWLPYSALQRAPGGLWSVFVLEGGGEQQKVASRTVRLVQLEDELALASGSIAEGELIVLDGLNRIVPGQLVRGRVVTDQQPTTVADGARE